VQTCAFTGFGGAEDATKTCDPAGGTNQVAKVVKSAAAELWAGTTVWTGPNKTIGSIPFTSTRKKMSMQVWSPTAGIPVRLKLEDAADAARSVVETEAVTTGVNTWETLVFDFANPASGTAALNPAYVYTRGSVFFNVGTTGAAAGAQTYYFDDLSGPSP
jgi:hypothetical protein